MRVSAGGDEGPSKGAGEKSDPFRPWGWPLLIIGGATFLGLVASVQSYYSNISAGRPMAFWEIARYWLPDYYVWAALTPAIVRLARRLPLRGATWKASLATHVAIAPLFAAIELLLSCIVISLIAEIPASYGGLWGYFTGVFSRNLVWGILVYAMIVAAGHAYDLYREVQRRELQTTELEGRLARARLRALETKLRPHFLFNTLHSIGMLVRTDRPADALRTLAGLSDLLRRSLEGADEPEVSLAEELEFLERYLELEQIRFHDRLLVAYDVGPRTLDVRVPSLILQPLVESAVRYGVEPHAGPRHVRIAAAVEADRLVLEVVDDGSSVDRRASRERRSRLGLADVRERLETHYGSEAWLEVRSDRQGGVSARVELPLDPRAMRPPGREEKEAGVEEDAPDGTDGSPVVPNST